MLLLPLRRVKCCMQVLLELLDFVLPSLDPWNLWLFPNERWETLCRSRFKKKSSLLLLLLIGVDH
jgi:hypothetical protein